MPSITALKSLIQLSIPIILGQIGQMLIGTGDVYIAGLYSTNTVAAIGVANGLINPIFLFGIGLLMGVSPILSIEKSQGKNTENDLFNIIIYSLGIGIILSLICFLSTYFIEFIPIEKGLIPSIKTYIRVVSWSFPFAYLYQGIKEYLQAREEVFWPNLYSIIAVIVNVIVNAFLVFGFMEFKGVGEIGLAYASVTIRILLFLSVFVLVRKEIKREFNMLFIKRVFKFSLPVAFMFFLEVLAFCSVSVLSGFFSVVAAAANNIIMNLASIVFMVPLSISSAVAVRVGSAYGSNNHEKLKESALGAIILSFVFTIFSAATFVFFPVALLKFFTNDYSVIKLGTSIMTIVALFQLFDGLQVTLSGILRGMDQTKLTSIVVFMGYWVFGIPTGLYLAYAHNMNVYGLWVGLAISLALVALALSLNFVKLLKANYTQSLRV